MQSSLFETTKPGPVPTLRVPQPYAELVMAGHKHKIFTGCPVMAGKLAIYTPNFYLQGVQYELIQKPSLRPLIDRPLEELEGGCLLGLVDVVAAVRVPVRKASEPFWQNLCDEEIERTDRIAPGMRCLTVCRPRRLERPRMITLRDEFCKSDCSIFEEIW